jgi:3-oxoacyl-[acyl-carrier-protein] synthase-3
MTAAVVAGLGSWLPPRSIDNAELAVRFDTTDEWIRSRTGIRRRRVIVPGMSTADLATEAGARALKSALNPEVDAVVLATSTPDYSCPATAPDVASRLGLTGAAAMDVSAVCTGFVYGLATGAGLISAGIAARVLVIGADCFSTILAPDDRTNTAIFGDGAGAVVVRAGEPEEPGALGPFSLGSDGTLVDLLTVPAGGSRQRGTGRDAPAAGQYLRMKGRSVFRHAVLRMAQGAREALAYAGWDRDDVDRFVGHQANIRVLNAVADALGLDRARTVSNIDAVGNTVAASIPLALADAVRDGRLVAGHRVLLSAFGGGLTWGATTLRWPDVTPI